MTTDWSKAEPAVRGMLAQLDRTVGPGWREVEGLRTASWLAAAVGEIDRLRAELASKTPRETP